MIGPNSRPTVAVPWRWIMNKPTITTSVAGSTIEPSEGSATFTPSTAESTEMAGVSIASP